MHFYMVATFPQLLAMVHPLLSEHVEKGEAGLLFLGAYNALYIDRFSLRLNPAFGTVLVHLLSGPCVSTQARDGCAYLCPPEQASLTLESPPMTALGLLSCLTVMGLMTLELMTL